MSKKEKDFAYYKKYVIIDLWVLLILSLLVFIIPVMSGIFLDVSLKTGGLLTTLSTSLGLLMILLICGQLVLFVICMILTKKEHSASGILNIVLAILYLINYKSIISIIIGLIHLINSIGYQKHLTKKE